MLGTCVHIQPDGTLVTTPDARGVCSGYWLMVPDEFPQPILPPLSAAEGAQVGAAIIGCWIAGAVVRWLRAAL
jgi:hypothetical protein